MIFLYWLMSLSMILFHVLLILGMAPLIMVFMERLNGKIQGKPLESSQYVLQNIKIIYSRILNFLFKKILSVNTLIYLIIIGLLVTVAISIPIFSTNILVNNNSDFIFVTILLIFVPFLIFFLVFQDCSLLCFKKSQRIMFQTFMYIPAILLIAMVCRLNTKSTELSHIVLFFHNSTSLINLALCPLFICACSLFFLVLDIPDFVNFIEKDGFDGDEKAILFYISSLQFLIWLSLIAFLIWPQSIAIFDLQTKSLMYWLLTAFFGLLAWSGKIVIECIVISLMRNFLFLSKGYYKIGIATVLNFVAVVIYFAGLGGI